jgi:hypothetical protein
LGIDVFGRDPNYDTTSDPIVRVTAAEIRKRIAQFYQENAADPLKISLPAGSYIPHFEWPSSTPEPEQSTALPSPSESPVTTHASTKLSVTTILWASTTILILLALTATWIFTHPRSSALDKFWSPILGTADSVTVCYPQVHFSDITLRDAADTTQTHHLTDPARGIIADDLQPLVSLSNLMDTRNHRYSLRGDDESTLTDLRQGPTIFLGAFDNYWTLRLTRGLRFRFGNNPDMTKFWIEDTQSAQRWVLDRNIQETIHSYRDYAIVARFRDANTGQPAVVVAGIARGGTVAAGEFLTQPANLNLIASQLPKNWASQNMEFVLSTEIIDGRSSPPHVEATYFW